VKNLAIVFGGVIFGEDEIPKGGNLLSIQTWKDTLMEDLITHAAALFDDRAPAVVLSAPLPPAPTGQPAPNYTYGSAHTKVATVPAPPLTPIREKLQLQPQSPEDFTPRLPPRPANSIHPSSRSNPISPTRVTMDIPPLLPARSAQASAPKPAVVEKTSPPKPTPPEKPPPAKASETAPVPFDVAPSPPSPSATSTMVATEEEDEATAAASEPREESAPPSPIPPPKSPQMPNSAVPWPLASVTSEATKEGDGNGDTNTDHSPDSCSVPGGFSS